MNPLHFEPGGAACGRRRATCRWAVFRCRRRCTGASAMAGAATRRCLTRRSGRSPRRPRSGLEDVAPQARRAVTARTRRRRSASPRRRVVPRSSLPCPGSCRSSGWRASLTATTLPSGRTQRIRRWVSQGTRGRAPERPPRDGTCPPDEQRNRCRRTGCRAGRRTGCRTGPARQTRCGSCRCCRANRYTDAPRRRPPISALRALCTPGLHRMHRREGRKTHRQLPAGSGIGVQEERMRQEQYRTRTEGAMLAQLDNELKESKAEIERSRPRLPQCGVGV